MTKARTLGGMIALSLGILAVALVAVPVASAQCLEPDQHVRGGLFKMWVLWFAPGPGAQDAIFRVINEVNQERLLAQLPLLQFIPQAPLIFSVREEKNSRGPDGQPLANRLPNQEVFFATFAGVEGGGVVLLHFDSFRSNAELTAKGLPGVAATFKYRMEFELEGTDSKATTHWVVSNPEDEIEFSARYTSAAIVGRTLFPSASSYRNCNLGLAFIGIFRSLPTEAFEIHEFREGADVVDFVRANVSLKVEHHDPDIHTMFNDPDNQMLLLAELDTFVRFQRR